MLSHMHFVTHRTRWALPALLVLGVSGCIETYKPAKSPRPRTEQLTVKHRSGGTHYRMLVDDGVWYQLLGTDLLVLDAMTGRVSYRESLAVPGTSGPAIDVVRDGDELLVVLEDSGVVRLTLDDPRRPWLEETTTSSSLGIRPRGIVVIDGARLVYGDGGVVDLDTGHRLAAVEGVVTSVDESSDGLVYCLDRRIHMMADDDFVGSANILIALRGTADDDPRRHVFVRNEQNGSLVGVMGADLRELDTEAWTVPMPGTTASVRQHDDLLVVTSNLGVRIYRMGPDGLKLSEEVDILGALDAMLIDDEQLVMSGTFGRGTWRLADGLDAQRRTFSMYHPEPAGLHRAVSDGRNLLADSDRGMWLYRIGQETAAQVSSDTIEFTPASREAVMLDWNFRIVGDGREVEVETPVGVDRLVAPRDGRFHCVVAADGVIWLGHDRGIIMVRLPSEGLPLPLEWESMSPEDRMASGVGPLDGMTKLSVRLDGPVFFIEPLLLGGGIAYVSGAGGFGVVSEEF
tara:strand:+ start:35281 stop:36825 length:1545 start_codon:yes stop_codon:yes gene_type:complete